MNKIEIQKFNYYGLDYLVYSKSNKKEFKFYTEALRYAKDLSSKTGLNIIELWR